MFGGMRVVIVPDDNADADPRIPKDILDTLGQHEILTNSHMMYIRASQWERIKHRFVETPVG
jgi:hypothetical protein